MEGSVGRADPRSDRVCRISRRSLCRADLLPEPQCRSSSRGECAPGTRWRFHRSRAARGCRTSRRGSATRRPSIIASGRRRRWARTVWHGAWRRGQWAAPASFPAVATGAAAASRPCRGSLRRPRRAAPEATRPSPSGGRPLACDAAPLPLPPGPRRLRATEHLLSAQRSWLGAPRRVGPHRRRPEPAPGRRLPALAPAVRCARTSPAGSDALLRSPAISRIRRLSVAVGRWVSRSARPRKRDASFVW